MTFALLEGEKLAELRDRAAQVEKGGDRKSEEFKKSTVATLQPLISGNLDREKLAELRERAKEEQIRKPVNSVVATLQRQNPDDSDREKIAELRERAAQTKIEAGKLYGENHPQEVVAILQRPLDDETIAQIAEYHRRPHTHGDGTHSWQNKHWTDEERAAFQNLSNPTASQRAIEFAAIDRERIAELRENAAKSYQENVGRPSKESVAMLQPISADLDRERIAELREKAKEKQIEHGNTAPGRPAENTCCNVATSVDPSWPSLPNPTASQRAIEFAAIDRERIAAQAHSAGVSNHSGNQYTPKLESVAMLQQTPNDDPSWPSPPDPIASQRAIEFAMMEGEKLAELREKAAKSHSDNGGDRGNQYTGGKVATVATLQQMPNDDPSWPSPHDHRRESPFCF